MESWRRGSLLASREVGLLENREEDCLGCDEPGCLGRRRGGWNCGEDEIWRLRTGELEFVDFFPFYLVDGTGQSFALLTWGWGDVTAVSLRSALTFAGLFKCSLKVGCLFTFAVYRRYSSYSYSYSYA